LSAGGDSNDQDHFQDTQRNAVARFNQVRGATDPERDAAWQRILAAAKTYGVTIDEANWRACAHRRPSRQRSRN